MTFTIPYPTGKQERASFFRRFGLNSVYAGKHWSQRKKDAEEWHWLVLSELRRQGIPRSVAKEPVEITFWWDDRLDIDNHALMAKMTVDALKGYLLSDDDRRHYAAVEHRFWNGGCIRVEIAEARKEHPPRLMEQQ